MFNILFSFFVFCTTIVISGQALAVDINQMVGLVVRNNETYQQAEARYRASIYQQNNAEAADSPQVSLNAGHQYIDDSNQDDLYNSSNASVRINQSLFNSTIDSASQQAAIQSRLARTVRDQALQTLLKELAELYFDYTDIEEQYQLISDETEVFENLLATEQEKYNAKISSIINYNSVRADLFQAQSRKVSQQSLLESAGDRLGTFLGIKAELPKAKPGEDLSLSIPEGDEQRWVATAMDNNLGIHSAQLAIENVEEQIRSADGSNDPGVSVFGSYSWNRNDMAGMEKTNNQAVVGIELSWLLYDGGSSSSRTDQYRENYRAAQLELEGMQEDVANLIRYYWRTLKAQLAVIEANGKSAEAARQSYQATQISFDAGTMTYSSLLESQNRYFAAERSLRASRYQFMRDYIQLYYNAGVLNRENFVAIASQWIDS